MPNTRDVEVRFTKKLIVEQKVCLQCEKPFEGVKIAQFCSKLCANKASYRRHAEKYRATKRAKYKASHEA